MPAFNPTQRLLAGKKPVRRQVVIVFTDILESTQANLRAGDPEWTKLRERHFAIAKKLIPSLGGALVKTIGDAVMAVFGDEAKAVLFARKFQQKLAGLQILVRIGVHAGKADIGQGDVHGVEVNKASRVAAFPAGGEIVVSDSVRNEIETVAPRKFSWQDLGPRELKGFPKPERLWQLVPGAPAASDENLEAAVKKYNQQLLAEEFRWVNLLGLGELKEHPQIELPRVFVMPRVETPAIGERRGQPKILRAGQVFLEQDGHLGKPQRDLGGLLHGQTPP
jgi:class 3 adenylate cyclase